MKAEYFPPKVDIILQNEIPTDFYILVSGALVWHPSLPLAFSFYEISYATSELYLKVQDMLTYKNGMEQVCSTSSSLNEMLIYHTAYSYLHLTSPEDSPEAR